MLILIELLEFFLNYFFLEQKKWLFLIHPLQEKVFKIEFLEFKNSIFLFFSNNRIYIFNTWHSDLTCIFKIRLNMIFMLLMKLKKMQNFNSYSCCEIIGDLETAKNFIKFWDEVLSFFLKFHINNFIFLKVWNYVQYLYKFFKKRIDIAELCLNIALTDEWKVIPHNSELLWFYRKIYTLKLKEKQLFKRLKDLEKIL